MTWEKQKAYEAKRAQELATIMEQAIAANDNDKFTAAYTTAMRYMSKAQRKTYYIQFLQRRQAQ